MRIIAGKYKGLKLEEFNENNIRPTLDKVRQGIFNKIQFEIENATFLDLFCGTGAMSLEAKSRNAVVTSVELDKRSIKVIQKNYSKAKIEPNVLNMDYKQAILKLSKEKKVFDFIFLDPPFSKGYEFEAIKLILESNILKENGIIIYEHLDKENCFDLGNKLEVFDYKKYGSIGISYIRVVKNV